MACRQSNRSKVHPGANQKQFVRINGWTRPVHYLQIVAWVVLVIFALIYFGLVAPAVSSPWKPAAFVCLGVVYVVHFIVHILAVTINPADENAKARIKENHQVPEFDRSKHQHVIENEYCHLCETYVSKKSKHCKACNKCVSDFDHHCLWLNNCVGSSNYKYFFATIATALLGVIIIIVVSLFVFINTLLDFQLLDKNVWWYKDVNVSWVLFETFIGIMIALCILCLILLGQLLFFHLLLIHKKMTTYEYIQGVRGKRENKNKNKDSGPSPVNDDACATPPDFIDTSVASKGRTVIVEMSGDVTDDITKLEKPKKKPLSTVPQNGQKNEAFVTDKKSSNQKTLHPSGKIPRISKSSEFTNHAFAHDEKNSNENSNATLAALRRPSSDLSFGSASLGELGPWDDKKDPKMDIQRRPSRSSTASLTRSSPRSSSGLADQILNEDAPIEGAKNPQVISHEKERKRHKLKRKRVSKKAMMLHSEDGAPRPLPVLPENSKPNFLDVSPRIAPNRLPPLRGSIDWASSNEDLRNSLQLSRKLPPLSASSSMNSLVSYGSLDSNGTVVTRSRSSNYSDPNNRVA